MRSNTWSKRSIVVPLLVLALGFGAPVLAHADDDDDKGRCGWDDDETQQIVVHLKRHINDLQGAIIGTRLAYLLQLEECADVTLFLTLQGVRLADTRMPQDLRFGIDEINTLADWVGRFQGAGGEVAVCPACAAEVGLTGDDLIEGAMILNAEQIADLFLNADKVLDF